jgi:hypothetical protein
MTINVRHYIRKVRLGRVLPDRLQEEVPLRQVAIPFSRVAYASTALDSARTLRPRRQFGVRGPVLP